MSATRFRFRARSLWLDFEFNRRVIDPDYLRSIPLFSSSVLDARNAHSLNALNACSHGGACRITCNDYVVNERKMEGSRLIENVFLYLDRLFIFSLSLFDSQPVKTDID